MFKAQRGEREKRKGGAPLVGLNLKPRGVERIRAESCSTRKTKKQSEQEPRKKQGHLLLAAAESGCKVASARRKLCPSVPAVGVLRGPSYPLRRRSDLRCGGGSVPWSSELSF